jgi:hypothetical protein
MRSVLMDESIFARNSRAAPVTKVQGGDPFEIALGGFGALARTPKSVQAVVAPYDLRSFEHPHIGAAAGNV